jgi:hypothetical protein
VEELLQASLGCFVPLDLAWPSSRGGVVDELLLDLKACAQTGCVVAGGEELRAGQHEVALARPLGRGAQAVAEFELGLEKVCLQPRHRFGIEPVLTKGVRGRACERDVGSEVAVEGVLVLLFDGWVGQGRVDDRHVGRRVPEHDHDRLDAGSAFGELGADGVPESVRGDRCFAGRVDQARRGAGFGDMSKSSDLDSSLPRTTKMCWTSRPALGS